MVKKINRALKKRYILLFPISDPQSSHCLLLSWREQLEMPSVEARRNVYEVEMIRLQV